MAVSTFERFRILATLGAGGEGEVFLAEDSVLRRKVALKKLSQSCLPDLDSRRRLLHEARAAARLNHPLIAGIHDVIETDDGAFIVMEYVPGESLARRLEKGSIPARETIEIGIQVCEALSIAHDENVVHRDLKPSNINLKPDGMVKILDFGVARTHHTSRALSADSTTSTHPNSDDLSGAIIGTFAYMPPEVLQGSLCDARGDIYSLGVTLFELLTGKRPFDADNRVALIAAITSQRTPRACEFNAKVSNDLSAVVARAMARDPLDRYQSASELQSALRRLLDGRVKLQRRLMGAAIAVVAVGIGLWASLHPDVFRSAVPASKVVAVLPFLSLGPDSVSSSVAAGITDVVGTNLAMLPISVVPAGETSRFRAADRDLDKVAAELGVSLVIDGSVQKYGDQLRVTLKILRSGSNSLAWTHICDGSTSRVLQLQEEILGVLLQGLTSVGMLNALPNADARQRLTRSPTHNEDAYADYNQARAFLDRDDIPENVPRAIALFESAVDKDPQFALAFGGLGEACFAQYRKTRDATWTQKAMQATAKALVLDPTSTGVRYSRAVILLGSGKLEEAERELQRVVREQPNQDAAHSLLGDVHDKQGRQQEAIGEFQAAIRLRRAYWRHHWRLASVYLDRGQLKQARAEARRVTELQPDNPRGHQLLGTVEQTDGKIDAALTAYETSLKLSPTAAAYSNIGGKFFDEKSFPIAETYYRKAVEIDPKLPVYRRNLGDVLVELGRESESRNVYFSAVELADSILRINPTDASTIALQALCLAKLNQGPRALETIAAAKRLTPSSANVLYKQTAILALLGHRTEALQVLEQALAAGLPPSFAVGDPDLESMSKSPEFDRLVARYRKG